MGVGITAFLDIKLREYLAFIESGNIYVKPCNHDEVTSKM